MSVAVSKDFYKDEKLLTNEIEITSPDKKILKKEGFFSEFEIKNPILWWTYELSSKDIQPLYLIKSTLKYNGKIIDTIEKSIGLRALKLCKKKTNGVKAFNLY